LTRLYYNAVSRSIAAAVKLDLAEKHVAFLGWLRGQAAAEIAFGVSEHIG